MKYNLSMILMNRDIYFGKLKEMNLSVEKIDREDLICCGNCKHQNKCRTARILCSNYVYDGYNRMNRLIEENESTPEFKE